jgi:hypothetical protein
VTKSSMFLSEVRDAVYSATIEYVPCDKEGRVSDNFRAH